MHLTSSDPQPQIDDTKYTLFGHRFCPFVDRVRLVLSYHGIDYDLVLVSLTDKPDWFTKMSPTGKVPLLLNKGEKLIESDLIMRFIDDLVAEKGTLMDVCGVDLFKKSTTLTSSFFKPLYSIAYGVSFENTAVESFKSACHEVENAIQGKYLAGDQLSLADLVLFPFLDRFEVGMGVINNVDPNSVHEFRQGEPGTEEWPVLINYLTRIREQAFVASFRQSSCIQARYAATRRANKPDPEIQ